MRRFSLKSLFASLTLAGIGLAIIGGLATREYDLTPSLADIAAALAWLGGGMILGAGLLLPFNRPVLGMILGFAVQFLILGGASDRLLLQLSKPALVAGFFMRGRMGGMLESIRSQALVLIAQFGGAAVRRNTVWPKLFLVIASLVAIIAVTAFSTGLIRWRFTLRTLLIATTLVAVVLGLIVWLR